jgi:hypothetical protein
MYKLIAILALTIGEGLMVYAEMIAARAHSLTEDGFWPIFLKATGIMIISSTLLIAGYMHGYKSFKNIWIVSALSITLILIMEPLIGYLVFGQLPTRGALYGLVLGALGFVATFVL